MLTSKLTLVIFTWCIAFLVSISLRAAGIFHPQPFYINHLLVWLLVFGPSVIFLFYFLLKRFLSADSLTSSWDLRDYKFSIHIFYFHFKPWCGRFTDFWPQHWYLVDLCTDFAWPIFSGFYFSMAGWTFFWKSVWKIY